MTAASQETWILNLNLYDTNVTSEGNMPHFLQIAFEIGGTKWK